MAIRYAPISLNNRASFCYAAVCIKIIVIVTAIDYAKYANYITAIITIAITIFYRYWRTRTK
jgi:hypothetical protein